MIVFTLLKETLKAFVRDKATRLSAALAYYSLFSLGPLLMIAIAIAGAIFGPEAAHGAIEYQLTDAIGQESAAAVQGMIDDAYQDKRSILMTIVGISILLLTASVVFAQLKDAMNTVWGLEIKPEGRMKPKVKRWLLALSMVLVIGFLLLTSLVLSTTVNVAMKWVGNALPIPGFVFVGISLLVSIGVVTLLFAMIFKILPDAEIQWRDVWIGALLTATLFSVGKELLAMYLGREGAASAYGAAGALVLLLSWVYYSANILMLGAEFTQVYARHKGRRIQPAENARRIGSRG
jgi:membrane protein